MLILYAEDDFEDVEIFSETLLSIDPTIKCLNARNGLEALEMLEHSVVLPDYIFLDINMPSMDGKACLKHLKRDERLKTVPVIIFTTSNSKRDKELCMELGADEYIQKPSTVVDAVDKLSRIFRKEKA